jgi:hypothetical protein
MALPNSGNEVPNVSAATAAKYVEKLVALETVESRTNDAAFRKLSKDYGLTVSQLVHLYKGRAKTCDVSLYVRIKRAYYDRCARLAAALQHEMAIEEARGSDAFDADLAARAAVLLAEAQAKRAALNTRGEVK